MTQVNPEALVESDPNVTVPPPDPDLPAESIKIRIDDDGVLEWLESLHPVFERHNSTKGTTNPKSHHRNRNPNTNTNSGSQRFSASLKATTKANIIGLPGAAVQHSGHLGHSARRNPPPIFGGKGGRPAASVVTDPGSPKVSCFGEVSCRESKPSDHGRGCWSGFLAWFRRREPAKEERSVIPDGGSRDVATVAPPGLGGIRRFVSGRRSASWGGDVVVDLDGGEEGHVPWSGPLVSRL